MGSGPDACLTAVRMPKEERREDNRGVRPMGWSSQEGPTDCRSRGARESGLAGQEMIARDVWA